MKNCVALIALISNILLTGMDYVKMGCKINDTEICITNGPRDDIFPNTLSLMVVGKNQQRKLKKPKLGDCTVVGSLYNVKNNTVYVLNKEAESDSEDDTYKPFDSNNTQQINSNNRQQLWHNASSYRLETPVMGIIEPRISAVELNGTLQQCYMVRKKENELFTDKWYSNDAALVAAKQDLEECYKKVLAKGATKVADKEHKSIGLPALSTEVGFPREEAAKVAVTTICEYIKNNPNAYNLVHLFVKKRSEAILYFKLFTDKLSMN